jgi:predicted NAD/FAD-dependent oxidoreductase
VTTHWFAVDEAPGEHKMIVVDQRHVHGPVVNTAVMSNAAPGYAPAGRHLVQASTLLHRGEQPVADDVVRTHVGELWGVDASSWELLRRDDVSYALPEQPAPLVDREALLVDEGLIVAGDHMDTGSIQGAMVSGRRAAEGWIARVGADAAV